MPTSEGGTPSLVPQHKGAKYDMVSKQAGEALDALYAFDESGCVACRVSDLSLIKQRTQEYVKFCQDHATLPTVTGLAARLGVTRTTINEWLKDGNYPETQQYMRVVKTVFADMLEQGALNGAVDKIFSMFLLKSVHDYQEVNKVILEAQPNQYGEELTDDEIESIIDDD